MYTMQALQLRIESVAVVLMLQEYFILRHQYAGAVAPKFSALWLIFKFGVR